MTVNLLLVIAVACSSPRGHLLLERSLTRVILGTTLIGNAVNLLILSRRRAHRPDAHRRPPRSAPMSDPLSQAMVLTAIVITLGVAAFLLAIAYRSSRRQTATTKSRTTSRTGGSCNAPTGTSRFYEPDSGDVPEEEGADR